MGRFDQEHKNYEQYEDDDCYRKSVPHGMADAVAEVLAESVGSDAGAVAPLRDVVNDLLSMAGGSATQNWEVGPLRAEVRAACQLLCEQKFPRFMDGVLNAAARIHRRAPPATAEALLRNLNEVFAARNFAYTLRSVPATEQLRWEARSEAQAGIAALDEVAQSLRDICPQALEHLEQARAHLLTPGKPRSRKDAVRDAMSAVEAFAKALASETDFERASKKLRSDNVWGQDHIVKEGHSTWGLLHRLYPDLRHGQATETDLPLEEALYWIDRMMTYVKYMAAQKRVLGR